MLDVGSLLTGNARISPDKVALIIGDQRITYGELNLRVNQLAHGLSALGVARGSPVVIYLENCLEWVEAYYAASKLGAPVIPVNPRLSAAELAQIVESSGCEALIFGRRLWDKVAAAPAVPIRIVVPDHLPAEGAGAGASSREEGVDGTRPPHKYERVLWERSDEPHVELSLADPHSICFTSGTTGVPKGAILTQSNLVMSQFYLLATQYQLRREDVFLIPGALSHRTGWGRLMLGLSLGATLVILDHYSPEAFMQAIATHRITGIGVVPTFLRLLARLPDLDRYDIASVRTVFLTGEGTPPELKALTRRLFPNAELWTFLSSTEAGTLAILRPHEQFERPLAAGRPIPGIQVKIVDADGHEQPTGTSGEIWVNAGERGTYTMMSGYLGLPEENANSFTGRWFHTADCGYLDPDGYIYMTDRKSDMIISGGINVYSKEVENALLIHPDVEECAVVGVADPTWGELIKAFVVVRPGAVLSEVELMAAAGERLASFKRPRLFEFVDSLPRSSAGKVLKSELRARSRQPTGN